MRIGRTLGTARTPDDPIDLPRISRPRASSSVGPPQLIMSTLGWVRKAVSSDAATVQVILPDEAGRLRVFATDGDPVAVGRLRSSRRRQVFASLVPQRIPVGEPPGWSIGIYPLVADDEAIGVMEVVAPSRNLEERREVIDAVIGQSANVFKSVVDGQERTSAVRSMGIMLRLATDLLRAGSPSSAVRSTVQRCFEQFGSPVVGLLPDRSGPGWFVAAAAGVGARRRAMLVRCAEEIGALGRSGATRERLAERFATIVGRDRAEVSDAGSAVLLTVDEQPGRGAILQMACSLLSESLDHIETVEWARMRNDHLDLALACTAHELQGPLAGVRVALDHVEIDDPGPRSRELLRRTKDELGQLAELVDPLLRWSAGTSTLHTREVDLVRLVREAVASSAREPAGSDVVLEAPEQLMVWADGPQLRGAIGNMVRNALAYSPPSEPVTVVVEDLDEVVRIRVRDRGRGVPLEERHLVFDPFARGRDANGVRDGRGLGLFIARRIVEAHGGRIGLRPADPGVEFWIELSSLGEGRSSSAS